MFSGLGLFDRSSTASSFGAEGRDLRVATGEEMTEEEDLTLPIVLL
jgi:hypothetical protein